MNRKNRGKSQPQRGKKSFRGGGKGAKFTRRRNKVSSSNKDTDSNERSKQDQSLPMGAMNQKWLTERDVGVTEYISLHEGFSGIIKQRFSDFHVNEIDGDGNVVVLTSTTPPEPTEAEETKEKSEEYMKEVLPKDTLEKLKLLLDSNGEDVEIDATTMSKEDRKKIHKAILSYCGKGRVISNTKDRDGKKYITISKLKHNVKQDRRSAWPAEKGDYVYFVLHKENMDTMETVNLIANKLRTKPNMITYAGTKDRRAKTSQLMSVYHVDPEKLASTSRSLHNVTIGNYTFKPKGLKLGDLKGNRFRIVLRNVTGSDTQIEQSMTSLKAKGFLNYYGLQRFGTSQAVPTHEIGKALLQGNWKEAVELILKPREGESFSELIEARKLWWETRDAAKAYKILRNKDVLIEGKLLLGLSLHGPNDYVSALENIPRNSRLLYLHSYQSLLWNKVASRRVKEFGLKPLEGDLVLQDEDVKLEIVEDPPLDEEAASTAETTDDNSSKRSAVRVLTADELESVQIYDVVLPLPGHDIMYPKNVIREWFEELLKSDGLSSAGLKQTVRQYSVSGAYRRLVIRPTNVSWSTTRYSDPQTTLMLSDLEEMQKVSPPKDEPDGPYRALILDFCLPSSTYATMALREILKSDTSSSSQASLNDYHLPRQVGDAKENGTRDAEVENGNDVAKEGTSKMTTRRNSTQGVESSPIKSKGKDVEQVSSALASKTDKNKHDEVKMAVDEGTVPKKAKTSDNISPKVEVQPLKTKGKRTSEHLDGSVQKTKESAVSKKVKMVESGTSKLEEQTSTKTRGKRLSDNLEVSEEEGRKEEIKMDMDENQSTKKMKTNKLSKVDEPLSVKTRGKSTAKNIDVIPEGEEEAKMDVDEPVTNKKVKAEEGGAATRTRAKGGSRSSDVAEESEDTTDASILPPRTRSKALSKPEDDVKTDSEECHADNPSLRTRSKVSSKSGNDSAAVQSDNTKDEDVTMKPGGSDTIAPKTDKPLVRTRSRVLTKARDSPALESEGVTDDEEITPTRKTRSDSSEPLVRTRSKTGSKRDSSAPESEGVTDEDEGKVESFGNATPTRKTRSTSREPLVRTRSKVGSKPRDSPVLESEGVTDEEDGKAESTGSSTPTKKTRSSSSESLVRTRSKVGSKRRDSPVPENDVTKEKEIKVESCSNEVDDKPALRTRSKAGSKSRDSPAVESEASKDIDKTDSENKTAVREENRSPARTTRSKANIKSRDSSAVEQESAEDKKKTPHQSATAAEDKKEDQFPVKTRSKITAKLSEGAETRKVEPEETDDGAMCTRKLDADKCQEMEKKVKSKNEGEKTEYEGHDSSAGSLLPVEYETSVVKVDEGGDAKISMRGRMKDDGAPKLEDCSTEVNNLGVSDQLEAPMLTLEKNVVVEKMEIDGDSTAVDEKVVEDNKSIQTVQVQMEIDNYDAKKIDTTLKQCSDKSNKNTSVEVLKSPMKESSVSVNPAVREDSPSVAKSAVEDSQSIDETTVKQASLPDDKSAAEEDTPTVDETSVKEDAPFQDKTAVKEDAPSKDETAVKEDAPFEDETAVKEDVSSKNETSMKEGAPSEETSVKEGVPSKDKPAVKEGAPSEDETAMEEGAPFEDETAVKEGAPSEDKATVKEGAPSEDKTTVKEGAPSEDKTTVKEGAPSEDKTTVEEGAPSEDKAAVKEEAPSEDEAAVKEGTPSEDEVAVKEDAHSKDETAVKENTLLEDKTAVKEAAPSLAESTVREETLSLDESMEQSAVNEDSPSVHEKSAVKVSPSVDDQSSVKDVLSVDDVSTVKDALSVDDVSAVKDALSVDDVSAMKDVLSVDDVCAVKDDAPSLDDKSTVKDGAPSVDDESTVKEDHPSVNDESAMKENAPSVDDESAVKEDAPSVDDESAMEVDDESAMKEDAPSVDDESAMKEDVPPVDDESAMKEDASSVDDESAMKGDVPPVDDESAMKEDAPPVDDESAMKDDAPPVDDESAMKDDAPAVDDESAMKEDAPAVDEESAMKEDAPAVDDESAMKEDAPAVDDESVKKADALAVDDKSTAKEDVLSVDDESVGKEDTPIVDDASSVKENTPSVVDVSVVKDDDKSAVKEEAPSVNDESAVKDVPPGDKSTVKEDVPPVDKSTVKEDVPPVDKSTVKEDVPPGDKSTEKDVPPGDKSTVKEDVPPGDKSTEKEDVPPVDKSTEKEDVPPVDKSTEKEDLPPVDKSTEKEDVSPVDKSTEKEDVPPVDTSTVKEDVSPVDKSTVKEDVPPVDKSTVKDDVPPVDKSTVKDKPSVKESVTEENVPSVDKSVVKNMPCVDESAGKEDALPVGESVNKSHMEVDMPMDESPVEEDMPMDESPVEEDMPMDESPVEEDMPMDESVPKEAVCAVKEDTLPLVESATKEDVLLVDESAMKEDTPAMDESAVIKDTLPIDESAVKKDKLPGSSAKEDASSMDELALKEDAPPVVESVVKEDTSSVDEISKKEQQVNESNEKEVPSVEETIVKDDVPSVDGTAEKDDVPFVDEPTVNEDALSVDKSTVKDDVMSVDETSEKRDVPSVEETAMKEDAQSVDETAVKEDAPSVGETAVKEDAGLPVDETAVKDDGPPVDETIVKDGPSVGKTAMKDVTSVDKTAMKDDVPSVADTAENEDAQTLDGSAVKEGASSVGELSMQDDALSVKEPPVREVTPAMEDSSMTNEPSREISNEVGDKLAEEYFKTDDKSSKELFMKVELQESSNVKDKNIETGSMIKPLFGEAKVKPADKLSEQTEEESSENVEDQIKLSETSSEKMDDASKPLEKYLDKLENKVKPSEGLSEENVNKGKPLQESTENVEDDKSCEKEKKQDSTCAKLEDNASQETDCFKPVDQTPMEIETMDTTESAEQVSMEVEASTALESPEQEMEVEEKDHTTLTNNPVLVTSEEANPDGTKADESIASGEEIVTNIDDGAVTSKKVGDNLASRKETVTKVGDSGVLSEGTYSQNDSDGCSGEASENLIQNEDKVSNSIEQSEESTTKFDDGAFATDNNQVNIETSSSEKMEKREAIKELPEVLKSVENLSKSISIKCGNVDLVGESSKTDGTPNGDDVKENINVDVNGEVAVQVVGDGTSKCREDTVSKVVKNTAEEVAVVDSATEQEDVASPDVISDCAKGGSKLITEDIQTSPVQTVTDTEEDKKENAEDPVLGESDDDSRKESNSKVVVTEGGSGLKSNLLVDNGETHELVGKTDTSETSLSSDKQEIATSTSGSELHKKRETEENLRISEDGEPTSVMEAEESPALQENEVKEMEVGGSDKISDLKMDTEDNEDVAIDMEEVIEKGDASKQDRYSVKPVETAVEVVAIEERKVEIVELKEKVTPTTSAAATEVSLEGDILIPVVTKTDTNEVAGSIPKEMCLDLPKDDSVESEVDNGDVKYEEVNSSRLLEEVDKVEEHALELRKKQPEESSEVSTNKQGDAKLTSEGSSIDEMKSSTVLKGTDELNNQVSSEITSSLGDNSKLKTDGSVLESGNSIQSDRKSPDTVAESTDKTDERTSPSPGECDFEVTSNSMDDRDTRINLVTNNVSSVYTNVEKNSEQVAHDPHADRNMQVKTEEVEPSKPEDDLAMEVEENNVSLQGGHLVVGRDSHEKVSEPLLNSELIIEENVGALQDGEPVRREDLQPLSDTPSGAEDKTEAVLGSTTHETEPRETDGATPAMEVDSDTGRSVTMDTDVDASKTERASPLPNQGISALVDDAATNLDAQCNAIKSNANTVCTKPNAENDSRKSGAILIENSEIKLDEKSLAVIKCSTSSSVSVMESFNSSLGEQEAVQSTVDSDVGSSLIELKRGATVHPVVDSAAKRTTVECNVEALSVVSKVDESMIAEGQDSVNDTVTTKMGDLNESHIDEACDDVVDKNELDSNESAGEHILERNTSTIEGEVSDSLITIPITDDSIAEGEAPTCSGDDVAPQRGSERSSMSGDREVVKSQIRSSIEAMDESGLDAQLSVDVSTNDTCSLKKNEMLSPVTKSEMETEVLAQNSGLEQVNASLMKIEDTVVSDTKSSDILKPQLSSVGTNLIHLKTEGISTSSSSEYISSPNNVITSDDKDATEHHSELMVKGDSEPDVESSTENVDPKSTRKALTKTELDIDSSITENSSRLDLEQRVEDILKSNVESTIDSSIIIPDSERASEKQVESILVDETKVVTSNNMDSTTEIQMTKRGISDDEATVSNADIELGEEFKSSEVDMNIEADIVGSSTTVVVEGTRNAENEATALSVTDLETAMETEEAESAPVLGFTIAAASLQEAHTVEENYSKSVDQSEAAVTETIVSKVSENLHLQATVKTREIDQILPAVNEIKELDSTSELAVNIETVSDTEHVDQAENTGTIIGRKPSGYSEPLVESTVDSQPVPEAESVLDETVNVVKEAVASTVCSDAKSTNDEEFVVCDKQVITDGDVKSVDTRGGDAMDKTVGTFEVEIKCSNKELTVDQVDRPDTSSNIGIDAEEMETVCDDVAIQEAAEFTANGKEAESVEIKFDVSKSAALEETVSTFDSKATKSEVMESTVGIKTELEEISSSAIGSNTSNSEKDALVIDSKTSETEMECVVDSNTTNSERNIIVVETKTAEPEMKSTVCSKMSEDDTDSKATEEIIFAVDNKAGDSKEMVSAVDSKLDESVEMVLAVDSNTGGTEDIESSKPKESEEIVFSIDSKTVEPGEMDSSIDSKAVEMDSTFDSKTKSLEVDSAEVKTYEAEDIESSVHSKETEAQLMESTVDSRVVVSETVESTVDSTETQADLLKSAVNSKPAELEKMVSIECKETVSEVTSETLNPEGMDLAITKKVTASDTLKLTVDSKTNEPCEIGPTVDSKITKPIEIDSVADSRVTEEETESTVDSKTTEQEEIESVDDGKTLRQNEMQLLVENETEAGISSSADSNGVESATEVANAIKSAVMEQDIDSSETNEVQSVEFNLVTTKTKSAQPTVESTGRVQIEEEPVSTQDEKPTVESVAPSECIEKQSISLIDSELTSKSLVDSTQESSTLNLTDVVNKSDVDSTSDIAFSEVEPEPLSVSKGDDASTLDVSVSESGVSVSPRPESAAAVETSSEANATSESDAARAESPLDTNIDSGVRSTSNPATSDEVVSLTDDTIESKPEDESTVTISSRPDSSIDSGIIIGEKIEEPASSSHHIDLTQSKLEPVLKAHEISTSVFQTNILTEPASSQTQDEECLSEAKKVQKVSETRVVRDPLVSDLEHSAEAKTSSNVEERLHSRPGGTAPSVLELADSPSQSAVADVSDATQSGSTSSSEVDDCTRVKANECSSVKRTRNKLDDSQLVKCEDVSIPKKAKIDSSEMTSARVKSLKPVSSETEVSSVLLRIENEDEDGLGEDGFDLTEKEEEELLKGDEDDDDEMKRDQTCKRKVDETDTSVKETSETTAKKVRLQGAENGSLRTASPIDGSSSEEEAVAGELKDITIKRKGVEAGDNSIEVKKAKMEANAPE